MTYSYPDPAEIEATVLDIFNSFRDEFSSTLALPVKSISVNHTFQVGRPIGSHREQDNKFIENYKSFFVVLNEERVVVAWEMTNSTLQDKIEPPVTKVKFKLKNNQISYIFIDAS